MSTFVLVPGFWLGAWAWRNVASVLRAAGHDAHPLTLTGLADRSHLATPDVGLDTHTTDIVRLIETEDLRDVVLVAHSGGGMPAAQAADRIPERIARVVYVDSGPLPDGTAQFDTLPPEEQKRLRDLIGDGHLLPPPAWEPEEDPENYVGLDTETLALLRARSTPQPVRTATDPVRVSGRQPVPTALIACTFPAEVARQMIAQGHSFFAGLAGAEVHGLPTGHWPMLGEPKRLAELLMVVAEPATA
ncbi:alpha/beta fold hydrolase [Micromonospora polyrhachis]|uniref:Pimeloyl-ACP methyl ester carboxylesterase n=1 Tax=Micromonospora polyrhachis TaxID=1282883 RepID=A0A7W7WS60_9ACTN|nr:alpha/beta hydrolase [Micromonospora polyrhachis]MBB4961654.1 pimeloyl-ACP methyl ester carboxylesterase [Micromonospora polyrhachis]